MRLLVGVLAIMSIVTNVGARQPRILKTAQIGHPCLYKSCEEIVDFEDPEFHKFMIDMRATFAYDNLQTAGFAAPQFHVNKSIIMYWDGYNAKDYLQGQASDEHVKEMINPEYEPAGDELEYRLEGCKSINGLAVDVPRYLKISVKWQDIKGDKHEQEFEGRVARCLQHEIDHVKGILCLMRADDMSRVGEIAGRRCFLEPLGKERPCTHTQINDVEGKCLGDYSSVKTNFGHRILEIAKVGHPVLYQTAEEVKDPTSDEIKEIIADMRATIEDIGYAFSGLAAPQVHISKNISFFFGGFHDQRPVPMKFEPLTVMINLQIEPIGEEKEFLFERCFSAMSWAADVPRYKRIKFRYQDEMGVWVEGEASGFTARVFQHEYDHLNGKVCFMRTQGRDRIGFCDANCHTHLEPLKENHKPW